MSDENPKILGMWECNVCVLPQYWAPRGSKFKPTEDEDMRRLVIQDVTPEQAAIQAAEEAERAAVEAAKEAARQERLGKKPMSEETKAHLREIAESKKAMKNAIRAQFDTEGHPEVRLIKAKTKFPVFNDLQKQAEICAKFPWVVPNSFKQDPEKSGGTLLAIKCQSCSTERIIHLADAFHCKSCKSCKGKNGAKFKVGQQPASGSDSESGATGTTD